MRKIILKKWNKHTIDLHFFKLYHLCIFESISTSNFCRSTFVANRCLTFETSDPSLISFAACFTFAFGSVRSTAVFFTICGHHTRWCTASGCCVWTRRFSYNCRTKFLRLSLSIPLTSLYKIQEFSVDISKTL